MVVRLSETIAIRSGFSGMRMSVDEYLSLPDDGFRYELMMQLPRKRAFARREVLVALGFAATLAMALPPMLSQARATARTASCADNLRSIGQGMHIYSNDNSEWFPQHYSEPHYEAGAIPGSFTHSIRWMGTMGTNAGLRISQATSPTVSPRASHPSRSLFLLVTGGMNSAAGFACPDSRDEADDLINYGPDAGGGPPQPGVPGVSRFDFRGYGNLSYGYQLPYGRRGRPNQRLEFSMPIVADRGPYFAAGLGARGSKTIADRRSSIDPPTDFLKLSYEEILKLPAGEWAPFNSRNHGGAGQNLIAVDGSGRFAETPLAGVHDSNIYTLAGSLGDPRDHAIGFLPAADETYGPLTQTDSFIVP